MEGNDILRYTNIKLSLVNIYHIKLLAQEQRDLNIYVLSYDVDHTHLMTV